MKVTLHVPRYCFSVDTISTLVVYWSTSSEDKDTPKCFSGGLTTQPDDNAELKCFGWLLISTPPKPGRYRGCFGWLDGVLGRLTMSISLCTTYEEAKHHSGFG